MSPSRYKAEDTARRRLEANPYYGPARENMRRYCERFGLDPSNWSINPGAD
jgi:hypothetical protein